MLASLSIFQIFLALIAAFFLVNAISKFARRMRSQTIFKLFLAVTLWGGVLGLALFPRTAQTLSSTLGLGGNLNTLIFIGFVVVFIVLFKLLSLIEKLERQISEIVRKEALEKIEKS